MAAAAAVQRGGGREAEAREKEKEREYRTIYRVLFVSGGFRWL